MDSTAVRTVTENNIADTIIDTLFINERRNINKKISIDDIRGYISPIRDAWANRVTYSGDNCNEKKIREVQHIFKSLGSGVTWIVNEKQIGEKLSEKLISCGFKPARYHKVAGMIFKESQLKDIPHPEIEIEIHKAEQATIERHIDTITRASSLHDTEYVRYQMAYDEDISSIVYFAYEKGNSEPIADAKSIFLENGKVHLLSGAAVLPEYRNMGVYSALLKYRINEAARKGVTTHVIQSHRNSSFSTCARFGFIEVCSLEFYEWNPKEL